MKLYRYRTTSHKELNILRENKLWFSLPSDFEDIFDCGIPINSRMSSKDALDFMNDLASGSGDFFSKAPVAQRHLLQNLAKQMHDRIRRTGICCFSEAWETEKMWNRYADKHNGICIEYEVPQETFSEPKQIALKKIRYEKILPEPNLSDFLTNPEQLIKDLTRIKRQDWSYEQERRILIDSLSGLFTSPFKITSIIFGLKTDEKTRNKTKQTLGNEIAYFQTHRHPFKSHMGKAPC